MIELLMFLFIAGGQKKQAPAGPNYYGTCVKGSHLDNEKCVWDKVKAPAKAAPHRYSATVTDEYGDVFGRVFQEDIKDDKALVMVVSADGNKTILLGYDEYSHLQSLRQAVVDEEKRLAVKYGACIAPTKLGLYTYCAGIPDHFEYHGQFLLIERGK